MLASRRNGTLYVGVTSDIVKRVWTHKNNIVDGFTKLYDRMETVLVREKALKA